MIRSLSFVTFQACWWAVILSAKANSDALGIATVLLLNGPFFFLSKSPRAMALFVAAATLIGFIVDSTMLAAGVFRVAAGWHPIAWLCPPWLAALWLNFAFTFDFSLAWMKRHPVAAALFAAVGGPLSYWAGYRWDSATSCPCAAARNR